MLFRSGLLCIKGRQPGCLPRLVNEIRGMRRKRYRRYERLLHRCIQNISGTFRYLIKEILADLNLNFTTPAMRVKADPASVGSEFDGIRKKIPLDLLKTPVVPGY